MTNTLHCHDHTKEKKVVNSEELGYHLVPRTTNVGTNRLESNLIV